MPVKDIIPLLSLSSSRKQGGVFTVEPARKDDPSKPLDTSGPISLCELVKEEKLKKIHLVESNFISFMAAQKNLKKQGCDLAFGLKLIVTDDIADKTEDSFKNESKIVIFMDNSDGYQALKDIYTKAATDGFYYCPRIDWKTLKYMWNDNLILSLPFYSSFLARNALSFSTMVPDLPAKPEILREIGQELPFDGILNDTIDRYAKANDIEIQSVKSIYYKNTADAKKFLIWRCIFERGSSWDSPRQEHMSSPNFSWQHYKELIK